MEFLNYTAISPERKQQQNSSKLVNERLSERAAAASVISRAVSDDVTVHLVSFDSLGPSATISTDSDG